MVYTYSSPNTMWINVVHKYNSWLLYYEMLCHHWETSAQDPNDHTQNMYNKMPLGYCHGQTWFIQILVQIQCG